MQEKFAKHADVVYETVAKHHNNTISSIKANV